MKIPIPHSFDQESLRQLLEITTIQNELCRNWTPHPAQEEVAYQILTKQAKYVFLQWGRQSGKTEIINYLGWIWGKLVPGSQSHYFAPQLKQARNILWTPKRLQRFGPDNWIEQIYESTMRITWKNHPEGLFQLNGADDPNQVRGIFLKNGILILDELRDFPEDFWVTAEPIILKYECPVIFISTPPPSLNDPNHPDMPNQYKQIRDMVQNHPRGYFSKVPTTSNPHIPAGAIDDIKTRMYSLGQGHIFEREYNAEDVKGGSGSIFPMLSEHHYKEPSWILDEISRDRSAIEWWGVFDPGSKAAFAFLLIAYLPSSSEFYVVAEIYERDQGKNSAAQIWARAKHIIHTHCGGKEPRLIYDEAALWFANEVYQLDRSMGLRSLSLTPTHKQLHKKEIGEPRPGTSRLKEAFLGNQAWLSTDCKSLKWELENYFLSPTGMLPNKNDHLIDCLFYFITESGYNPYKSSPIILDGNHAQKRITSLEDWNDADYQTYEENNDGFYD